MLLNRSIALSELDKLLNGEVVEGRFDLSKENQSNQNYKNVLSFFPDDYWWIDSSHRIQIKVDIDESRLLPGVGVYYAAKNFEKTHIWTGRKGKTEYQIPEYYCYKYNIHDVKYISGLTYLNRTYQHKYREKVSLYNIDIMLHPSIKQEGDFNKFIGVVTSVEYASDIGFSGINNYNYYDVYYSVGDKIFKQVLWLKDDVIPYILNNSFNVYIHEKYTNMFCIDIFNI